MEGRYRSGLDDGQLDTAEAGAPTMLASAADSAMGLAPQIFF